MVWQLVEEKIEEHEFEEKEESQRKEEKRNLQCHKAKDFVKSLLNLWLLVAFLFLVNICVMFLCLSLVVVFIRI